MGQHGGVCGVCQVRKIMKALLFNRIRTLPVLACLCLSLLPVARAQTGVVAASGVPVPGAIIRATQGGTTLTAATDDEGRYRLDGLTNGTWVMEVEMFRFETARQGVRFEGASHLAWNLKLKPLSAAAPASAPAIQIAQNGPRTSQGPGQQRRQHQMRQQNGHRGAAIPELSNQIAGGTNAGN